jgi:hypothetical protein
MPPGTGKASAKSDTKKFDKRRTRKAPYPRPFERRQLRFQKACPDTQLEGENAYEKQKVPCVGELPSKEKDHDEEDHDEEDHDEENHNKENHDEEDHNEEDHGIRILDVIEMMNKELNMDSRDSLMLDRLCIEDEDGPLQDQISPVPHRPRGFPKEEPARRMDIILEKMDDPAYLNSEEKKIDDEYCLALVRLEVEHVAQDAALRHTDEVIWRHILRENVGEQPRDNQ